MLKTFLTAISMGRQAVEKKDTEIAHKMAMENPELFMDAQIAEAEAKKADLRQRFLAAQTAKVEDEKRNAAAQEKVDVLQQRMGDLKKQACAAKKAGNDDRFNKAIAMANRVKPQLDAAQKALATELANDDRIDSMLKTVEAAYEKSKSELQRKIDQKQSFVATMAEAKATEDIAAMEAEIEGLFTDDDGLNADQIMQEAQSKAEERLRELDLMRDEVMDPNGMADVDAFLADDGKSSSSDPMDVFK